MVVNVSDVLNVLRRVVRALILEMWQAAELDMRKD